MAKAGIKNVKHVIQGKLDGMLSRARDPAPYIKRKIFPKYQNVQRARWDSENNTSEVDGGLWARLNPSYAARKLKIYKDEYMGGTKMMVATGTLYKAVIGENTDFFRMIISNNRLIFALEIDKNHEYFKYTDASRTYTKFSRSFWEDIKHGLAVYMGKGKE